MSDGPRVDAIRTALDRKVEGAYGYELRMVTATDTPDEFTMLSCRRCGALVKDIERHEAWHAVGKHTDEELRAALGFPIAPIERRHPHAQPDPQPVPGSQTIAVDTEWFFWAMKQLGGGS